MHEQSTKRFSRSEEEHGEKSVPILELPRSVACVDDDFPTNMELYPYSVKELVGKKHGDVKIVSDTDFDKLVGNLCWKRAPREKDPLSRSTIVEEKSAGENGRGPSEFHWQTKTRWDGFGTCSR